MTRPLTLALLAVAIALTGVAPSAQPARPNIIFILADDLGHGELGSYGQTKIRTQHLDRMAAEGMRFTQFYAGSTVCAPSRSVLMTGQHMGRTTVRGNAGAGNLAAQTPGVTQAILLEGRWKGMRLKGPDAPIQLFDLENDLGETRDVAGQHPRMVERIAGIMREAHVPNEHWGLERGRPTASAR